MMGNREKRANESAQRLAETRGKVGSEVEQRVRELGTVVGKMREKQRQSHKKSSNGGSLKLDASETEVSEVTEPPVTN